MAAQYTLIGSLLLVTTGVGENYTFVDEEGGCSLTDADRGGRDERCTKKSRKRIRL